MKKFTAIAILVGCFGFIALVHFWPSRHEAVFYPMGGMPFRIIAYDRSGPAFKDDVRAAEERVEELEMIFSSSRYDSEVNRLFTVRPELVEGRTIINHGVPRSWFDKLTMNGMFLEVPMSADMARVILSAKDWWEKTGGAFDVTVGPLIRLWKEAVEKGILPSEKQIKDAKAYVGMDKISPPLMGGDKGEGDRSPPPLLPHRGGGKIEIDLGGIAKGDIVDQVAELFKTRGVKRGVIEAGGDIFAFGDGMFRFGIQNPTSKYGETLIGEIEIPAGSVVTSGNYERFNEIGGKKYSHIIDPKSGMPIDNGLVAVTVIGGRCIDADALATALMVLGRERAIEFLSGKFSPSPSPPPIEGGGETYKAILVEKNDDKYIVWTPSELGDRVHFEKPWVDWVKKF